MSQLDPNFYERYGAQWVSGERRQIEKRAASYKVSNLCSLMGSWRPRRILDFGCGLGDALDLLSTHFRADESIGIDLSSRMIEYARGQYPNYTFVQGSIERLKDFRVDLITFFDVLEHMEDIPQVLEVAKMRTDYIGIAIPLEKTWLISILNTVHLKDRRSRLYETEGHLYEFNRFEVDATLERAGLSIVESNTTFSTRELLFSPYMKERMKAKRGALGRLKYYSYLGLSKWPYTLSRPLFEVANGVDYFVWCKT